MFSELLDTTEYVEVETFSNERDLDRASAHLERCAIPFMIQHITHSNGALSFQLTVSESCYHAALRVMSAIEEALQPRPSAPYK